MVNINEWHQREASGRLIIRWNRFELSWAESDLVDVDLWGYYEDDLGPHWDYLQVNEIFHFHFVVVVVFFFFNSS
jgi:hypothetical protein